MDVADGHLLAPHPDPAAGGGREMTWWRRSLARLGGRTPVGRDVVVAAALAVLGLARIPLALLINDGRLPSPGWVVAAATVLSTLDFATIAVRRRAPRVALGAAVVVVLAATALPAAYMLTGIGVLVCAYTVATLLTRRQAIIALAVAAAVHAAGGIVSTALGGRLHLVATFWAYDGGVALNVALISVGSFAIPGLVGLYVQTTRAYGAELAARVNRLEEERELRAAAAAAEERTRIARELHDVAAHDLSAIVVQAGAADRLLDRDPARARDALRSIRAQGRRTLTAMRELVGIMRTPAGSVPSMSTVDELVASARDTGMSVTVRVTGTVTRLSPAADVAAYRLVQEALTNARQHAPGAEVEVCVEYRAAEVLLSVHNGLTGSPSAPDGGGHGLVGMRERVRHCGGELRAGPTETGGWLVRARLPHRERA
jgi:signal transduction histidine kinase